MPSARFDIRLQHPLLVLLPPSPPTSKRRTAIPMRKHSRVQFDEQESYKERDEPSPKQSATKRRKLIGSSPTATAAVAPPAAFSTSPAAGTAPSAGQEEEDYD